MNEMQATVEFSDGTAPMVIGVTEIHVDREYSQITGDSPFDWTAVCGQTNVTIRGTPDVDPEFSKALNKLRINQLLDELLERLKRD